jgi:hypothetical protein
MFLDTTEKLVYKGILGRTSVLAGASRAGAAIGL